MSVTEPKPSVAVPTKVAGASPAVDPAGAAPAAPAATTEPVSDIIDLFSGKEFNETAAVDLAVARSVNLIVCASPIDFGKTTLLTSLYELFQWAPVEGQRFAESLTLLAFEERCHQARVASKNVHPKTQRTHYKSDADYLHLRTSSIQAPSKYSDFLFTDVSGEMFDRAVNSEDECKQLKFIRRANHLLLLFDTGKAMQATKWAMLQNSQMLLRSFLDNNMLSPYCVVTVVWSKHDYFEAATGSDKTELVKFRKAVADQLQASFASRVTELRFRDVAARPLMKRDLGFGSGVPKLFADWVADNGHLRALDLHPKGPVGVRESELYAQRYFAEETKE
jgi:hypothetical protein